MEVSPQDEMANPQGVKVLSVERQRLPEDFVFFRHLCGVQSPPLVFAPNRALFVCGPVQARHRERLRVSCLRSPELSAEVRQENSSTSCTHAQMDAYNKRNGRKD